MKIAIYHNLRNGGGYEYVNSIVKELSKRNIQVDIYTHQKNLIKSSSNTYYYPLNITKNIFEHVFQTISETEENERKMSEKIINNNYNFIFIFPCHLQQCPNIINYLPTDKTYYFYLESLREFYEKTSFDYFSIKKIITRFIKLPIKIQDHINCKNARNIITDSYYSNYQLQKIYNKKSNVIYPGMNILSPKKYILNNNHKTLSFGLLSMLKGHHMSAKIDQNVEIYGQKSHEKIENYISKDISISNSNINNINKKKIFKDHSIFFANHINEPFGITTLEATAYNCLVLGKNEAGTCEIINNGNNGYLYDNEILAKKILNKIKFKKHIFINKMTNISWNCTIDKILFITKYA